MKVIKHGYLYNHNVRFHCGSCGCVFETENMTEMCLHPADASSSYSYYTAVCPECGCESLTLVRGS